MTTRDLETALDALRQEAARAGIAEAEIVQAFRDEAIWLECEVAVYGLRGRIASK